MSQAKSPEIIHIRKTILPSSLGLVLVAATPKGLCFVAMADTTEELEKALETAFPQAVFLESNVELADWAQQVVNLIEKPGQPANVPLDIRGTVFQQRVWHTLQNIPIGTTASYGEIAELLGMPKGARAVAGACAANDISLVIPCHRIVRKDGSSGGYRWGLERKEKLLEKESSALKTGLMA